MADAVEDFETAAAKIRTKIETYFSNLLGTIRKRQTELISELNEILSRYRQERVRLLNRVKELEGTRKCHEERLSSVGDLNRVRINVINSEIDELREKANSMSVEFKWSPIYAKEGSKIGELIETIGNEHVMPATDCSLFIFSKCLYEELIYRTDVGPIPRDSYREEHLSSEFANFPNWRVAIEGCYWCGKPTRANQYTYVCNKKCYSLLHEWCRGKVYELCGDSICMYPGCEKPAVENANCCSETHQQNLETNYKSIKNGNSTDLGPYWYQKEEVITNRKITQFFHPTDPQPHQQPFNASIADIKPTITPIKSLNKSTPHSIKSPNKSTSHSIKSPNKSTSHFIESPKKSTSHSIESPNKSTPHSIKSPNKSTPHFIESPSKSTSHFIESPNKSTSHSTKPTSHNPFVSQEVTTVFSWNSFQNKIIYN